MTSGHLSADQPVDRSINGDADAVEPDQPPPCLWAEEVRVHALIAWLSLNAGGERRKTSNSDLTWVAVYITIGEWKHIDLGQAK